MIISDVMDEVANQLDTIPGLRCFAWPTQGVNPPQAIVNYPDDYTYDVTAGRGFDRLTLPVVVVVGQATQRTARDTLSAFMNGAGANSVKAVIEAGAYTAFDAVRVTSVDTDIYTMNGGEYVVAVFQLDIMGQGK